MPSQDFTKVYLARTDEELLQLALDRAQLTPDARFALESELARRQINAEEHLQLQALQEDHAREWVHRPEPNAKAPSNDSLSVSQFVAEVLRVYYRQFRFFFNLTAPAVVVSTIAVIMARGEVREIARHLPRGYELIGHKSHIFGIWLINLAAYFVSWMAFSFAFGGICAAVAEIGSGAVPSVRNCVRVVRKHLVKFLQLSLLLFFLAMVAMGAAGLLGLAFMWALRQGHVPLHGIIIWLISFGSVGLAFLIFSRFGLAMPAVILDDSRVAQAMFRSDELTRGKWLILAAILAKSLIGGYVAGVFPFWVVGWVWAYVHLPQWLLIIASIAGVTAVEPFMFIGFAVLYATMSKDASITERSISSPVSA